MAKNLKNVRNGKSISKIPKWSRLRPLGLERKSTRQFEFLENLENILVGCCKVLFSNNVFHTNLLIFFSVSNRHIISFFNSMLFPFLGFFELWSIILSRSCDGLAVEGLF